jgi:hypothetical protein
LYPNTLAGFDLTTHCSTPLGVRRRRYHYYLGHAPRGFLQEALQDGQTSFESIFLIVPSKSFENSFAIFLLLKMMTNGAMTLIRVA